jgi:heat shock protein HtpX
MQSSPQPTPAASSSFLLKRVLLALLLTIGFYLLVFAIIAICGALLYWIFTSAGRIDARIIVLLVMIPLALVWSLLPRRDKFVPPGPKLERSAQPELFAAIDAVARVVAQKPPVDVYLIADVNAFVAERGGVLGIGSRRVMGVGLPLLQALSVTQFRGVLAHEFGHFQGGDTQLGGWIYKVRGAIGRTIDNLGGILQAPFGWYGKLFMRVTQAISRQQEFEADRLAAQVIGSHAMAEALRSVRRYGLAYSAYWGGEVLPLLNEGYKPPMSEGFGQFLQSSAAERLMEASSTEAAAEKTDPYDTHPALPERLAALQSLGIATREDDARPAIALLVQISTLEEALLLNLGGRESYAKLRPITWQDASSVYRARWERTRKQYNATLSGLCSADLGDYINAPTPAALTALRAATANVLLSSVDARRVAQHIAGDVLALALHQAGWVCGPVLGQPITLINGAQRVQPHVLCAKIVATEMTPLQWRAAMAEFGIAALRVDV